ncbi:uncharacterized protein L969DRAFT_55895 [Mixia osmundae IAM 14324]|uniref:Phospholipase n=1 Tax=Mixia osmundae (strain CBS 9802 / IAM 14324 / JCM 22182 / KY 12970) TaxID=764103 RepID=G7E4K0_MIXOS|nr:uncharacterized protein L969DRAFT_55895 [Mixia osmundae IAM 14324]KEI41859.1 hypothetical protein L969DRAFT_55895 [Mixia osmundae IAM 14324]GAA97760.1 hypothetical protein E5Q_04439 [Mixia osmundae IAM 14324]
MGQSEYLAAFLEAADKEKARQQHETGQNGNAKPDEHGGTEAAGKGEHKSIFGPGFAERVKKQQAKEDEAAQDGKPIRAPASSKDREESSSAAATQDPYEAGKAHQLFSKGGPSAAVTLRGPFSISESKTADALWSATNQDTSLERDDVRPFTKQEKIAAEVQKRRAKGGVQALLGPVYIKSSATLFNVVPSSAGTHKFERDRKKAEQAFADDGRDQQEIDADNEKKENEKKTNGDARPQSDAHEDSQRDDDKNASANKSRWAAVRQKLGRNDGGSAKTPEDMSRALGGHELVTELAVGMLSMMMIKMSMDRDEHGTSRIPVLMNYLKLRISDSVYPLHAAHALFRIELEYGDGLLKWVIYREMRDFVNLHAHYRVANLRTQMDRFPNFPKTSLPYFNYLKKEGKDKDGKEIGKQDFAEMQRRALENYLLKLIRATMFRADANRLCKFLEISALAVSLAAAQGLQGKQGYLRVLSTGASRRKRPGFHPVDFKFRHGPKWFIVRESYVVAANDANSSEIFDVFLMDMNFTLERPRRPYRQMLTLLKGNKGDEHDEDRFKEEPDEDQMTHKQLKKQHKRDITPGGVGDPNDPSTTDAQEKDGRSLQSTSSHVFFIRNSERKMKLVAKNERQMDQFIASIERMAANSLWSGQNRFDSFAPIRMNVAAQWLVDGRDYFWNLSKAIAMAKHTIHIHDWWISPELYLRRPPEEKWRFDNLLKRKAEEGVKVFIIVYREVSNDFTPVDSTHTKTTLLGLHPNIHLQRSPDHMGTRTLLWSHHEKMCVIDGAIAFMGGFDICFGRWDTPQHLLVDDDDEERIWPGKDYSNSRVSDFSNLTKPFEDMYDRKVVPRQPWHDIGLQLIGQPARDLVRHFVQRWNMLLRTKNHTRMMPFLLPMPDFTAADLKEQRITGTCEAQICRSCGPWSMQTPDRVEHSITTAYVKAIEMSDHYVHIENQFFITSTQVEGATIENKIGDALVSRILKAHEEGTPWRACIIIPLVPGYPLSMDHPDAGSVRMIVECQNRTIGRGEHSIFARLRRAGIDPDEYISFFSLRGWGRMKKTGLLVTQDIYIHAKCMIVDDRIVIIGSANINERSQRGDRDSELACVLRDTDLIDGSMGGKPYRVGRFAHTLRIRLMREHLGLDTDALEAEEANMDLLERRAVQHEDDVKPWDPSNEQNRADEDGEGGGNSKVTQSTGFFHHVKSGAHKASRETASFGEGLKETAANKLQKVDQSTEHAGGEAAAEAMEHIDPKHKEKQDEKPQNSEAVDIAAGKKSGKASASTVVPTLEEKVMAEGRPVDAHEPGQHHKKAPLGLKPPNTDSDSAEPGQTDRETSQGESSAQQFANRQSKTPKPKHTKDTTRQGSTDKESGEAEADEQEESKKSDMTDLSQSRDQKMTQSNTDADDSRKITKSTMGAGAGDPSDIANAGSVADKDRDDEEKTSAEKEEDRNEARLDGAALERAREEGNDAQQKPGKDIAGQLKESLGSKMSPYAVPIQPPKIDPKGFADPLVDRFWKDTWMTVAVRNTQIFRKVFRCVPDDLVTTWDGLKDWNAWAQRHEKPHKDGNAPSSGGERSPTTATSGRFSAQQRSGSSHSLSKQEGSREQAKAAGADDPKLLKDEGPGAGTGGTMPSSTSKQTKKQLFQEPFTSQETDQMHDVLEEIQGHLVIYPTRFLEAESAAGSFLFAKDRIQPIAIFD